MNLKYFYNLGKYRLYKIHRSITGIGIKKTLSIIKTSFPELKIINIPSQKKIFDWTVPQEWNIREAYVIDRYNNKIIDFKDNNLHIVSYSLPVKGVYKRDFLLKRLHSIPSKKKAIPYITSYYNKYWGFAVSDELKSKIKKNYNKNDDFKVVIDSSFKKGFLRYGELKLKGESKEEILISTYICHPQMANNELSGPIVSMALINYFKKKKLTKSLRFLFVPETIGSIAFLSKNLKNLKNIIGGFNLSCIGDERNYSFMTSKYANSASDNSVREAFKKLKIHYKTYSFLERGSDERQYNSPYVNLKIASIFRSKYNEFKQYHTSLDNFDFVTLKGIRGGFNVAKTAIDIFLKKILPQSITTCEPFLNKRKLRTIKSHKVTHIYNKKNINVDIVNFLQFADGNNDLENISKYIKLNIKATKKLYFFLKKKKLIK